MNLGSLSSVSPLYKVSHHTIEKEIKSEREGIEREREEKRKREKRGEEEQNTTTARQS